MFFLLVASALLFLDYACERRLCCRLLWRGRNEKQTREDQEREDGNDDEIPELHNSTNNNNKSDRAEAIVLAPTETDVGEVEAIVLAPTKTDVGEIQRIESLRSKRREIEHWFENKTKQESP